MHRKGNHMLFTANDNGDYVSGDYKICFGTRGYSTWFIKGPSHNKFDANGDCRCLGRELTISEAIQLAEVDALQA